MAIPAIINDSRIKPLRIRDNGSIGKTGERDVGDALLSRHQLAASCNDILFFGKLRLHGGGLRDGQRKVAVRVTEAHRLAVHGPAGKDGIRIRRGAEDERRAFGNLAGGLLAVILAAGDGDDAAAGVVRILRGLHRIRLIAPHDKCHEGDRLRGIGRIGLLNRHGRIRRDRVQLGLVLNFEPE